MNNNYVIISKYETEKHMLPKINIGDTVIVDENAKLYWFSKKTKKEVLGKIGKVKDKGDFTYTVVINGISRYFQRLDLKKVV